MPPKLGEFKTNYDGAMFNENDDAGIGIAVQDSLGYVFAAMVEKIQKPHFVEVLEMMAARRAVNFVHEIGLHQIHFEGDLEIGIKALCNGDMLLSSLGHLAQDTIFLVSSLRSFSFSHVVRQGNAIAHALAQRARISFPLLVWMEFTPSDIDSIIAINFPTS